MNPELTDVQSHFACGWHSHVTDAEMELLLTGGLNEAETSPESLSHLLSCEQCASEIGSLRESISVFRGATASFTDAQLRRQAPISVPARSIYRAFDAAWLVAAAAMFFAALLPMQMTHRHAPAAASGYSAAANVPAESDEALLEDVDRVASASIAAPMQVLADPASPSGGAAANSASNQRNEQ
jgi:hypothetical protein